MSYSVKSNNEDFDVVEKDTGLVVYRTESSRTARSMCRSLNLGSGFNGFTPIFFAETNKKGDSEESPFQ